MMEPRVAWKQRACRFRPSQAGGTVLVCILLATGVSPVLAEQSRQTVFIPVWPASDESPSDSISSTPDAPKRGRGFMPVRLRHLWWEVARITGLALPEPEKTFHDCKGQWPCIGRQLQKALGPRARLERIMHPDTDTIRFVHSLPTLTGIEHPAKGVIRLRIVRFGRRALREIRAALARTPSGRSAYRTVQIDLRDHPGGTLHAMIRLASGLIGPVPHAFALKTRQGRLRWIDLPDEGSPLLNTALEGVAIEVFVNGRTASSAEVFAALMRRYAGARVLGNRTFGKDWLLRTVVVSHDWRLLVPAERIIVPGETLAGGLHPDAPLDISFSRDGIRK